MSTTPRSRSEPYSSPTVPASRSSNELVAAPELAILIALDQLLALVNLTLVAVHPGLATEPSLLHPLDRQAIAGQIVQHGARLSEAIARYRSAVLAELHRRDTGDDLPF